MEIVSTQDVGVVSRVAGVLRGGGVVVLPTDTAYGLAADAHNAESIEKVYDIKNRVRSKPIHIIVSDLEMAKRYGLFNPKAEKLAIELWPGPLTIVVDAVYRAEDKLLAGGKTIGIRVPGFSFAREISENLGGGYTATSANLSGGTTPYSIVEVEDALGQKLHEVDLLVDGGALPRMPTSTLVDVWEGGVRILRGGAVSREEIERVVG